MRVATAAQDVVCAVANSSNSRTRVRHRLMSRAGEGVWRRILAASVAMMRRRRVAQRLGQSAKELGHLLAASR